MRVFVCVYIYVCMCTYTNTHTHIFIYNLLIMKTDIDLYTLDYVVRKY